MQLKQCKIFKSLLQWLYGRFHTLIWRPGRYGPTLESPRSSGRLDNTEFYIFFFFFQLKNVYSTRLELRPESRLWEPLLATWLVETTICKQQLQLSIYSSHIVPGFTKTECCLNISWKIRYHTRCSGTIRITFSWVRIMGLKNPIGDSHNPKARQSEWPPWKRCT